MLAMEGATRAPQKGCPIHAGESAARIGMDPGGHIDRGDAGTRPGNRGRGRNQVRPCPVPGDIGTMRDKRMIAGGRRDLRHVPFQTARAAACHNPVPKPLTKRLKGRGKPHKLIITAVARSLVTIANAVLKTIAPQPTNPVD